MKTPLCPSCGSEMRLRTARKGQHAGQQFYGCSSYPRCKATLPFDPDDTQESTVGPQPKTIEKTEYDFPRTLLARSRIQGYQVRYFETIGVPLWLLEELSVGGASEEYKRAYSQWRLDYPSPVKTPVWTERTRQIFSVSEKILLRGRVTLCSPFAESVFEKNYLKKEHYSKRLKSLEEFLNVQLQQDEGNFWFDSQEEKLFYSKCLPKILGPEFLHWVLPQVEISSLLPPGLQIPISGRVDFLICHPELNPTIVEIDGKQHDLHESVDKFRDSTISDHGYKVIRIPAAEVYRGDGPALSHLREQLRLSRPIPPDLEKELFEFILSVKLVHQVQVSILQAIQSGFLRFDKAETWYLSTDLDRSLLFNEKEALLILQTAIDDLLELFKNLGQLYSHDVCKVKAQYSLDPDIKRQRNAIHIAFTEASPSAVPTFIVQDIYLPFHIANSAFPTIAATLDKPNINSLGYFLNYLFRHKEFWEGQVEAISRTLQGKDSIVLLPTGAGKSLIFQIASLLLPGRTVVIDPIISLMDDQIDNLQSKGIDRCIAITGQITDIEDKERALALFGQGEYLFAYVAPERYQTVEFRRSLKALTLHTPIALIAVDEAHCVSEWGHDFRTAYLNIGRISREYSEANGIVPPLLALTGTASRVVLKDVQRELQIVDFDAIITPKSFDRPELKFHVLRCSSSEKNSQLEGYLGQVLPGIFSLPPQTFHQPRGKNTYSGLVFCPHVNGPFGVVDLAEKIRSALGVTTAFYSGKQPKYWSYQNWNETKQYIAHQFKHNKIPLLVCTKAFGMGIDKPNIRFTIHYGIPPSIESFYQEAGRAGRDRKPAHCCIIASDDDKQRSQSLLDLSADAETVVDIMSSVAYEENDDITRALYFQTNAFPGVSKEREKIKILLRELGDISKNTMKIMKVSTLKRNDAEKVLHRLLILGVVSDYTINYSSEEFTVKIAGADKGKVTDAYAKYVSGYSVDRAQVEIEKARKLINLDFESFVSEMIDLLLHFIYSTIERQRRRALSEMLSAATVSPTDEGIRGRVLRHLEATQYSEHLEKILASKRAGLAETREAFDPIRSPNEAAELRGQVARYLESYPDHPGLLMLRSLSEIYSRDSESHIVEQNFTASINSALKDYGLKGNLLTDFIIWSIDKFVKRNQTMAETLQRKALSIYPDRSLARSFLRNSTYDMVIIPSYFLLGRLARRSQNLFVK